MESKKQQNSYHIERLLHESKSSKVYLAQDQKKVFWIIKTTSFNSQEQKLLILEELKILSSLVHPNLLKIRQYIFNKKNLTIDIVTQLCQQRDIFQYTKKGKKTIKQKDLLIIFQQIVHTFIFMNLKGVTHGLLEPSKILVTKNATIKIADFGCFSKKTKIEQQEPSLDLLLRSEQEQHYECYDAPQVIENEDYGEKADVWAFGMIIYLLQVRKLPFLNPQGSFSISQMRERLKGGKLMDLPETSPSKLTRLVQLALVYDKNQRASWRQLNLSRIFIDKVQNVEAFLKYLLEISKIANYISKQFWKHRRQYDIKNNKDEIFVYFLTKFQLNSLVYVKEILNKNEMYRYLFEKNQFYSFKPSEQLKAQVSEKFAEIQKYVKLVSKAIHAKAVGEFIDKIDIKRVSFFSGLDMAIKWGFQVLKQVNSQFEKKERKSKITYIPWVFLAKFINFERWLVFERSPNIQKMIVMVEQYELKNKNFVRQELNRYKEGMLL